MTLMQMQLTKYMKHMTIFSKTSMKSLGMKGLYAIAAAACLWLLHIVTAPVGGIVLFSAVFTAGFAGFICAVALFHLVTKLPQWVHAFARQKQSA